MLLVAGEYEEEAVTYEEEADELVAELGGRGGGSEDELGES